VESPAGEQLLGGLHDPLTFVLSPRLAPWRARGRLGWLSDHAFSITELTGQFN
jgi:hypothetical protein